MKKCAYLCILLCHCHPSRNEVSAAELPIIHLLSYLLTLVETEPDMPSSSTLIIAVKHSYSDSNGIITLISVMLVFQERLERI